METIMTELLPQPEQEYLAKLITTLDDTLTNYLIAVYLFGSASYGAYEPGISDLDVQAVISSPLPQSTYRKLATQLGHSIIPCPARKLEFVLYTKEAVAAANPQFELDFNTGDGMTDYVCLDPSQEVIHWFLLDIASGREKGVALLGPPVDTVFAEPRHDQVVAAIVDSIEWHRRHKSVSANAIMNACRAWRFTETGTWGSKAEGVEWAARNLEPELPEVLRRVSLVRRGRTSLSGECDQFLEFVLTRIRSGRLHGARRLRSPASSTRLQDIKTIVPLEKHLHDVVSTFPFGKHKWGLVEERNGGVNARLRE